MKRRVYRARAWYVLLDGTEYAVTRHFQTKRARDRWAQNRRDGYDSEPDTFAYGDGRPAIPPALRVETADSDPVTFPDDQ